MGLNNNTLRNNDRHNKKDINIKKGNKYFNEGVSSSESEFNNNNEIIKRKWKKSSINSVSSCHLRLSNNDVNNNDRHNKDHFLRVEKKEQK